jgi:hypothetical protein
MVASVEAEVLTTLVTEVLMVMMVVGVGA